MKKKLLLILLCFFLILCLNNFCYASNEYTIDTPEFYLLYDNQTYFINGFTPSDYYNPETDLLVSGHTTSYNGCFYMVVLKNAVQYTQGNNKVVVQQNGAYKTFQGVPSTGSIVSLKFNLFTYNDNLWVFRGSDLSDSVTTANSRANVLKSSFTLYDANNTNTVVTPKTSFNDIPFIANTTQQLSELTVGELAIGDNGVPPSRLVVALYDDTIDDNIFSISLQDYSQYISRLDLEDPFSELGYVIPWKDLPPFEFTYQHQYTIYVYFASGVDAVTKTFTFVHETIASVDIPTSWTPPTPTGTPSPSATPTPPDYSQELGDINNSLGQVNDSINDSTNRILDDTVDDGTVNIDDSKFKLDYRFDEILFQISDIITNAFTYDDSVVTIVFPYRGGQIEFTSDYLEKAFNTFGALGSQLKLMINMFWIFLFGMYFIRFGTRVYISFNNGDFSLKSISGSEVISDTLL